MEYSIYHIENDIDCRVLKFGKEICVAVAGEESTINLCKGRHKLSFVSIENECDSYSTVLEVPENGIEDFIDIELLPIKNARVEKEKIEQENEQVRIAQLQEQERQRIQIFERIKKERERQEAEERDRIHSKNLIRGAMQTCLKEYSDISNIEDYEHKGLKWHRDDNELYFLSNNGTRLTDSIFHSVSRFCCGLARVFIKGHELGGCFGYINESGDMAIECKYSVAGHFYNGRAIVVGYRRARGYSIIDTEGNIVESHEDKKVCCLLGRPDLMKGPLLLRWPKQDKDFTCIVINSITREPIYSFLEIGARYKIPRHLEHSCVSLQTFHKFDTENRITVSGKSEFEGNLLPVFFYDTGLMFICSRHQFINTYGISVSIPESNGYFEFKDDSGKPYMDDSGIPLVKVIEHDKTYFINEDGILVH